MIAQLRGTVASRGKSFLVLDVNGVGYAVHVPDRCLPRVNGEPVTLYTYTSVREDAIELFGFDAPQDREFFRLLISINGIGPRAALNILAALDAAALARAIGSGDTRRLIAVNGIGKKTADRLVLELKEKVKGFADTSSRASEGDDTSDVLEVLETLGCEPDRAREAVEKVRAERGDAGFDTLLSESLQLLGAG